MRRGRVYVRRRQAAAGVFLLLLIGVVAAAMALAGGGSSPKTGASPHQSPTPKPLSTPSPIPGYLLIADRGNNRVLLVDSGKHVLWRYPKPGIAPSFPFKFDDDVFFGAFGSDYRRIISNQEDQHTIQIISFPGGKVLWHYGHPNVKGTAAGYLNTPDDAYLLPDGTVTVADAYNCRIQFISPSKHVTRQIGTTGACYHNPPTALAAVNGDTPMQNGTVLVSEITGSWVDAIGPTGRVLWSLKAPVAYPSDPQWLGHGQILLADYANPGHVLIMTTKGKVLWSYGPASGIGKLDHPSLAMMLPNGLIAVNDDFRHRVVLISRTTGKIVWHYGHAGHAGTRHGYLNLPDGMDFLPFDVAMKDPAIRAIVQPG